jgi:hypothetical protein
MTVGAGGFLKIDFASLSAKVGATISGGSSFSGNWRITEATQASPATKTAVWSGSFSANSSGGGVEVTVGEFSRVPVAATMSGACRYTFEVQRASGSTNVNGLSAFLALTWTPQG